MQVNNTVIDWFEPWPEQALQSVASVFLAEEVSGFSSAAGGCCLLDTATPLS